IRVYLDGVVQATTPWALDPAEADAGVDALCPTSPAMVATTVRIGGGLYESEPFHGSIDDVRIYSGVLSDDEIAALAADTP
ncbi:MAG: LamG-like jellyroll fold domain-containing protein, partial [Acidimicrobiia bacterium]